jgi:hypothetical protein
VAPDHVIDVDRLMAEVRERVAAKRAAGLYDHDPTNIDLIFDDPLDRASQLAAVAGRRETLQSGARLVGPAVTVARRASVKAVGPFVEDLLVQINAFHFEMVAALRAAEVRIGGLERAVQDLERRLRSLEDL